MEWWGWSDATSTWRRGRRLGRRALRQGRGGGSGTDKGVNAVDAAAGRHTSDEAGENRGGSGLMGWYRPAAMGRPNMINTFSFNKKNSNGFELIRSKDGLPLLQKIQINMDL
jgi:hypothetical protein